MTFRKLIVYNRIWIYWPRNQVSLCSIYIRNIKVNHHGDGALRRNHVKFRHPVYWIGTDQHYQAQFWLNGSLISTYTPTT